jgi:uncharacterized membrane protein YuzA (DUF378 family)
MSFIQKVLLAVTIIGGINWLLIGIFDFNLVTFLFMQNALASRILYVIIGLCALVTIGLLFMWKNDHYYEEI